MKTFLNIVRKIIVSPEFLIIVLGWVLLVKDPLWLGSISNSIGFSPESVKYIALIPAAILVWCMRSSMTILFPPDDTKGILQNWPRFKDLKATVLIGLVYQIAFTITGLVTWLYKPEIDTKLSIVLITVAICGALSGAVTFFLASLMAREITKKYTINSEK